MKLGRLFLRTVVGGYFVGHGTQKLFGWFNGHGIEGTAGFFGALGLRPAKAHAIAAGVAEAGGGAAIVLGAETPLASSALIATMITAIRKVHAPNGPWVTDQGYEYNLVLIAALASLAETGPGSPSIDAARGSEMHGPKWALLALALGAAGAAGAEIVSSLFPEPAPTPAPSDAGEPAPAPADAGEPAPTDAAEPAVDNGASAD
jgi:putative oxidoreductase